MYQAYIAIQIQIQVKHRRKYKSQDHQAGRWQHSCAWQRIIQPWAMITAELGTVGVISPESFIPGEQLWKLFPYSLKKSFGSDQPVPFLWNCLLSEIIESIADKVVSLFAVGNTIFSCCSAVQLKLHYLKHYSCGLFLNILFLKHSAICSWIVLDSVFTCCSVQPLIVFALLLVRNRFCRRKYLWTLSEHVVMFPHVYQITKTEGWI